MSSVKERLTAKLQNLDETQMNQVLAFVESLEQNQTNETLLTSKQPLLSIAGTLSGEPMTAEAIEDELYG